MNGSSKQTIFLMVVLATFAFVGYLWAATGDTLSVGNGSGLPGTSGHVVPVNLRNVTIIKAVMFKIKDIPDSITVTGATATGRASGFRTELATFGGTIKILMFPTDGSTLMITAGTGAICNLTLSVDPTAPEGSKADLNLDSVVVANSTNQNVTTSTRKGYFWFGTKGDVKHDGAIDLFDVLRLIDIALNRQPPPTEYERWAGDLNGDGVIDVVDISMAIDLAVASTPSMREMPIEEGDDVTLGSARLELPILPMHYKGTVKIPLTLKASAPVAGLQIAFKFDARRFQIASPEITGMSKDMSVAIHTQDGITQVMVYSLNGEPIPAGEGAVLMLPVTIIEALAEAQPVEIERALVATVGGGKLQAIFGKPSGTTTVMPESFALLQNNPNPFNMSTKITYEVPNLQKGTANIRIMVYNAQGQLVRVLEDQTRPAGRYTVNWDGRDEGGTYVSSGVYFYKMTAENVVLTKKLAVMK